MYKSIATVSPYGKLGRYVQPYAFPLPWWPQAPSAPPAPPAAAGGKPGHAPAKAGPQPIGPAPVVSARQTPGGPVSSGAAQKAAGPVSNGLGQSATGLRHAGWLGKYRGYNYPLPWRPVSGLGQMSNTEMLLLALAAGGAVLYFVWPKLKKAR
jgi:hypothetical protein